MLALSSVSSSIPPSNALTSGGTGAGAGAELVTGAKALGRVILCPRKSWALGQGTT